MAFLQLNVVNVPDEDDARKLIDLVNYFDSTYVTGPVRRIQRQDDQLTLRLRRNDPLYPASKWNVHEATLTDGVRTNNQCESWNNGFRHLVGQAHPSVWTALESFQMDEAQASTTLIQNARGQPPAKRVRRTTLRHQERLHTLCCRRRDGDISVEDMLKGVGHTIRLM